ncbi:hypothetical protein K438DRAFT_1839279 [Mycena galopus ATCC 62051]|nr:hypothetical protein K438DRAFT_1839279 [Mycena galopus ATCC 62051]
MGMPVFHCGASVSRETLVAPQLLVGAGQATTTSDDHRILVFENGEEVLLIRAQLAIRAIPRNTAVVISTAAIVGVTTTTAGSASSTLASRRGSGASTAIVVVVLIVSAPARLVAAAAAPATGPGLAVTGVGRVCIFLLFLLMLFLPRSLVLWGI